MPRRASSPRLVGRDRQLDDLVEAVLSDDPERPVVMLAGEAGIGKTRLLSELASRLEAHPDTTGASPTRVVRGSCLHLADGELPFAPILEVLDSIRAQEAGAAVNDLAQQLAGSGPDGPASADARTTQFLRIRDALESAAGDTRLLVVIDDLHWADQSTLDLVLFLARRLRGGRVVLLAAYRSDELHRRHPLRPVVAELTRGYVRDRIELGPLDRDGVAEQVRALADLPAETIDEIVARADGNPFHVEELVALKPGGRGLPPSLRDVLLARLAVLDESTERVLAACAVIGRSADLDLIAGVSALEPAACHAALRAAVDHWILAPDPDGRSFRFRHALLEEAVLDDLLPGDRVDLHQRVVQELRARAEAAGRPPAPGELARHLDLGGEHSAAIDAYLEAAARAFRALAWSEAASSYERAAELVAGAASEHGEATASRLQELVVPASLAMSWSGSPARSIAMLREQIARLERTGNPSGTAALWITLSQILNEIGDEPGSREAGRMAFESYEGGDATPLGIDLLVDVAAGSWIAGQSRQALELAERAVTAAEQVADPARLFRALLERGAALITLGHIDRGLADVDRARSLQNAHGWLDTFGHLTTNIPAALAEVGLLAGALELSEEGIRVSRELGIEQSWEPWTLPGLAMHALLSGRWAEADGPIAAARAYSPGGLAKHYLEFVAAQLEAGRGNLEACDAAIDAMTQAGVGLIGEYEAVRGIARAARADAAGDPSKRLAEAEAALASLEQTDGLTPRSRLAADAAAAAADYVAGLHPKRDRERIEDARRRARIAADLAVAVDNGRAVSGSASMPITRVQAALATAEALRAEGRDDPATWPPIAELFRELGLLPRVAYVEYRRAAVALANGDRSTGERSLREARDLAGSIGMRVLLGRIDALARAARIDTQNQPAPTVDSAPTTDPWGLSGREREVLALLADGRTNGEIGARLFISTKTASVHVTHILDKLGVSSRTEAALLASRAGLLDEDRRPRE